MKVSIRGLGWYGAPLALDLKQRGHTVSGSTRDSSKTHELRSQGIEVTDFLAPVSAEALVLNIPPFEGWRELFQKLSLPASTWVIFISSTSRSELLLTQEAWVKENAPTWTILRFGGLLGGSRHPGKHLAGRKGLKGRLWPVNLLHLDDAIGFTRTILEKKIQREMIEVVCDEHRSKEEFYTSYARENGLPLPEFDRSDESIRPAVDNTRAVELYNFTWP